MKKTLFIALVLASIVSHPAAAEVSVGTTDKKHVVSGTDYTFRATTYTSTGDPIVISSDGTTSGDAVDLSSMNLYFNNDATISGIKAIDADSPDGAGKSSTGFAWVVSGGKVVLDGVTGSDGCFIDLKQNLSIGTEFTNYGSAEFVVQNGAKVATTAYYNTVGANGTKGIVTVSGQGTELKTQQITFGAACAGLNSYNSSSYVYEKDGEQLYYWRPMYLDGFDSSAITGSSENFCKGYGIMNITDGAKVTIGERETPELSNSRLQIFNGEVNVSGDGSQLIMANGTHLSMDPNFAVSVSGLKTSLSATNGGVIRNDGTMYSVSVGCLWCWYGPSEVTSILNADGLGSRIDLASSQWVSIGDLGYGTSGETTCYLTATEGGVINLSSIAGIEIATMAVNYTTAAKSKVEIKAESNSSVSLATENNAFFGMKSVSGDSSTSISLNADGENAQISVKAGALYFNSYGDTPSTTHTNTLTAVNGGTLNLLAGTISFGDGTDIYIGGGSTFNTEGAVSMANSAGVVIDDKGVWNAMGSVSHAGDLSNDGLVNVYTSADISALIGSGTTKLIIGSNTITGDTAPILLADLVADTQTLQVCVDLQDPTSLLGKSYSFAEIDSASKEFGKDAFTTMNGGDDATFDWDKSVINFGGTSLGFTGIYGTDGLIGCEFTQWTMGTTSEGGEEYAMVLKPQEILTTSDTAANTYQYVTETTSPTETTDKAYAQNIDQSSFICGAITVNQKTDAGNYEPIQTNGTLLLFNSETTLTGESGKENSILGFTEEKEISGTNLITGIVDIAQVKDTVTLQDLTLNVGQRLEVVAGQTLNLESTDVHIGGGEVKDLSTATLADGTVISIEDNDALKLNSQVSTIADGATVNMTDSSLSGIKLGDGVGEIKVTNATINMKDSELGSSAPDAMRIALNNSSVSGTGTMNKVSMSGGSLTIGNSPGTMTIAASEFSDSTWSFYFITDAVWNVTGANTTTNPDDGAFSQLVVGNGNSASGITVKIRYEDAAGADKTKDDFEPMLGAGFSVKLIDNAQSLTLGGGNTVDASTLPTLQDGLLWDTTRLFSTGNLYVIHDMVADAGRIANTLVSAADTTVSFGRLARDHAKDARRSGVNAWVSGFGTYLNHSDAGGRTGFEYNTHGYAVGVDTELSKGLVTGVGFGQSFGKHKPNRGDAFYNAGEIDQDGLLAGIYASQTFDCRKSDDTVELDGYVAYGRYDNKSKRTCVINGTQAYADWKEDTMAAAVNLTRHIKLPENAELTPYVGAEYRWANMKDAIERNRSAVRYEGTSYQNLSLSVGIGYNKTYSLTPTQKLTPYASLAYVGDVMRKDAKVTAHTPSGETVVEKSAPHGRSALQVRVGAVWQVTDSWSIHAGYTGEIRYGADDHSANVGVSYSF